MSDFSQLIGAIQERNLDETIRYFTYEHLNNKTCGGTALHCASRYDNNANVVKYLLSVGYNIEDEISFKYAFWSKFWWENGWRSIHIVAYHGNIVTMKALIYSDCSLTCRSEAGETPLDLAIKQKHVKCAKILRIAMDLQLLRRNCLSKIEDPLTGKTVLDKLLENNNPGIMDAIKTKSPSIQDIKHLMAIKADHWHSESYKLVHECLLYRCIRHKYIDGFQILCTAEIVNRDSLFMGPTTLECATKFGLKVKCVEYILERLEQVDESWQRAEINVDEDILMLISSRRTYINNREERGYGRLHIAVYDKNPDMITYLLNNNIDNIYEGDKIVGSALSLAYDLGYMDCVQIFHDNCVDVNTTNRLRQSTLNVAISNRIEDYCDLLVDNTTDIEAQDFMGFTVLDRSVIHDCRVICEYLVKKGSRCDRYVNFNTQIFETDPDLIMVLQKTPHIPLTNRESIFSLCFKVNNTIYPCLFQKLNERTINSTDGNNNTMLHLYAVALIPNVCLQLIRKNADLNFLNGIRHTPLLEVLKHYLDNNGEEMEEDFIETINVLIDGGASLNVNDLCGVSVLETATKYNNERLLLALINKKDSIEYINEQLFSEWLKKEYFTLIQEVMPLVDKSVLISWISVDIIKSCLDMSDTSLMKSLYDKAASRIKSYVAETILYTAAIRADRKLFGEIINDQISLESGLVRNESLLHYLIREQKREFIDLVLGSKNAQLLLKKTNTYNQIPLHICIESQYWEIIDTVIMDSPSLDVEDNCGSTPLSLLMTMISEETEERVIVKLKTSIKMLITKSADIYKLNMFKKPAISFCTNHSIKLELATFARKNYSPKSTTFPKDSSENVDNKRQPEEASVVLCQICEDEPKNTALNCGHMFCMTCAEKGIYCYICRQLITDRIKLFV